MRTTRGSRSMVLPLLLVAGFAGAAESMKPDAAEAIAAEPAAGSTQAGQRAFIDPATGKLVPRSEAKMTPMPERGKKNFDLMWIETHADGSLELHHEGQTQVGMMATVDAKGAVHAACASAPEHSHEHPQDHPSDHAPHDAAATEAK